MLRMQDLIDPDLVVDFDAKGKEVAIRRLVEPLVARDKLSENAAEDVIGQLMKRELEMGSTGVGGGVAIPHTRSAYASNEIWLVVGRSRTPVEFGSVDQLPVQVFFCIVSPPDRPGDKLRAQEALMRFIAWAPIERLTEADDFKASVFTLAREFDERGR